MILATEHPKRGVGDIRRTYRVRRIAVAPHSLLVEVMRFRRPFPTECVLDLGMRRHIVQGILPRDQPADREDEKRKYRVECDVEESGQVRSIEIAESSKQQRARGPRPINGNQ